MADDKLSAGAKNDAGKLRYDLIPVLPLQEVARVYTIGAQKYEVRNWEKGIKWTRIFGALLRHAYLWWAGQIFDKDNGQHHLAAVVFNAFALMEYERTHPEFDDRWEQDKPLAEKTEVRVNSQYEEQIKKFETEIEKDIASKIPGTVVDVNISVTPTPNFGKCSKAGCDNVAIGSHQNQYGQIMGCCHKHSECNCTMGCETKNNEIK